MADINGDGQVNTVDYLIMEKGQMAGAAVTISGKNAYTLNHFGADENGSATTAHFTDDSRRYFADYLMNIKNTAQYNLGMNVSITGTQGVDSGLPETTWAIYIDDMSQPFQIVRVPSEGELTQAFRIPVELEAGEHVVRYEFLSHRAGIQATIESVTAAFPGFDHFADLNQDGRMDIEDRDILLGEASATTGVSAVDLASTRFYLYRDNGRVIAHNGTQEVLSDETASFIELQNKTFWIHEQDGRIELIEKIAGDLDKDGDLDANDKTLFETAAAKHAVTPEIFTADEASEVYQFAVAGEGSMVAFYPAASGPASYYMDFNAAMGGSDYEVILNALIPEGYSAPSADYLYGFKLYIDNANMGSERGTFFVKAGALGDEGKIRLNLNDLPFGDHKIRIEWMNPIENPGREDRKTGLQIETMTVRNLTYDANLDLNLDQKIDAADITAWESLASSVPAVTQ